MQCRAVELYQYDEGFSCCRLEKGHEGAHMAGGMFPFDPKRTAFMCDCPTEGCWEIVYVDGEMCYRCENHP